MQEQLRRNVIKPWYVDIGCSRHTTGDISQLHVIQTINGGYVSFAGGYRVKTTQKRIVINIVLSFRNVIYAPELKCSLVSVSQISLWTTDNDIRLSSKDLDAFFDIVHDVVQPR